MMNFVLDTAAGARPSCSSRSQNRQYREEKKVLFEAKPSSLSFERDHDFVGYATSGLDFSSLHFFGSSQSKWSALRAGEKVICNL
jgi:hypothetical protein